MDDVWQPSLDALVTELEHEMVLLHAVSGEMFSLNANGQAVWQTLPATLAQVATCLGALGADPVTAQTDARALLESLAAAGLVTEPGAGL